MSKKFNKLVVFFLASIMAIAVPLSACGDTSSSDNPGTNITDNNGGTDNSGGGSTDNSGSGSTDNSGSGSTDNSGSGSTDNSGSGSTDNSGSGSTDNSGSTAQKKIEVLITFDYNYESSEATLKYIDKDTAVDEPDDPTRTGYTFDGWYTEAENGTKVDFSQTYSSGATLYAHWTAKTYTVTLNWNYDGSTPVETTYHYGDEIQEPTDIPTNGDKIFYYWQTSKSGTGNQIDFPYTVTKDVTFYALWGDEEPYTVKFDANYEGGTNTQLRVVPDSKIKEKQITKPKRTYYSFKGWALTPDATADDIISLPYTASQSEVTLYAVWEQQTYSITFISNYPDASDSRTTVTVLGGNAVEAAKTPTRDDYTFEGWYTAKRGGDKLDFATGVIPSASTSYYAHWKLAEAVVATKFDAEFTEMDATKKYYGYSGEAKGVEIITNDTSNGGSAGATTNINYPKVSNLSTQNSYYVTYQYEKGDEIVFTIISSKAVKGATLSAALAAEYATNLTIGPEETSTASSYQILVNNNAVNYNNITFSVNGKFQLYTIGSIDLVEGENTIILRTNNTDSSKMGGAMKAAAPMVDYIQITNTGDATLSWYPIYDNIYSW
jgi:uncharacterized repeat protein (TIGR02543 family)